MQFKRKEILELIPVSNGKEEVQLKNFISYIGKIETETVREKPNQLKNIWATKLKNEDYVELYNKVLSLGLYIDGETVTIMKRGKDVVFTFDYNAYKNRVIARYPNSLFDHQLWPGLAMRSHL